MSHYVVTIARQFGSMGRPIAKKMAEELGIEFYDRDIVEEAARRMNLPISVVSDREEKSGNLYFNMKYPLGSENKIIQQEIYDVQKNIILELAQKESCIIVGRCSDAILENYKNCMSVFIYAPYAARFKNCVESLNMDPKEAKKMIADVDKARDSFHKKYAKYLPNDPNHKDVMIDSSLLGEDGTVDILVEIVKRRFHL